jgi:hypothetical protein
MERPYSRLYWEVMTDPKFAGIRDDCRLFGAWSLLLVTADMAWPNPPFVPGVVPISAVKKLAEAGLIDLTGRQYQVHGLPAERERRAASARASAHARWKRPESDGNANA